MGLKLAQRDGAIKLREHFDGTEVVKNAIVPSRGDSKSVGEHDSPWLRFHCPTVAMQWDQANLRGQ